MEPRGSQPCSAAPRATHLAAARAGRPEVLGGACRPGVGSDTAGHVARGGVEAAPVPAGSCSGRKEVTAPSSSHQARHWRTLWG